MLLYFAHPLFSSYCSTQHTHTFNCPHSPLLAPLTPSPASPPLPFSFCPLPQVKSPTITVLTDDSGRTLTSSDFNLRNLTPDQRVEGLLAFSNHEELDRFNQEARHGNRHPELFALCPLADEVRYRKLAIKWSDRQVLACIWQPHRGRISFISVFVCTVQQ